MKNIYYPIYLALLFLMTSCNFTENLHLNPDGTGDFSLEVDGSSFMSMAGEQAFKGINRADGAKSIDSTFTFKQLIEEKKDSIAKLSPEKQAAIKKLEKVVMNLKMNPEQNEFLFSLGTPFNKVNELEDMMGNFDKMKDLKGDSDKNDTQNPMANIGNNNSKLSFDYNGKVFIRKAVVLKENLKKDESDGLAMAKMLYESSKYILKYHFPKPVKKVSNPDALFSEDRKTITVEYSFEDYMQNPEKLNLNVTF